MNGFGGLIANGSNTSTSDQIITNDGYFPNVTCNQIRAVVRLDSSITNERLIYEIENSIIECNRLLSKIKNKHNQFSDITNDAINGKSIAEILYIRAVSECTAALVLEKYRSYDSSGDGQNRADDVGISAADHRRNQRYAIRDLLNIDDEDSSRLIVDLL